MIWQKNHQVQVRAQLLHSDIQQQGNNYNDQQIINSQDIASTQCIALAPSSSLKSPGLKSRH